jgi:hypothetical protein
MIASVSLFMAFMAASLHHLLSCIEASAVPGHVSEKTGVSKKTEGFSRAGG